MLQCYIVTMLQNRTSLMWQSGKVAMWHYNAPMLRLSRRCYGSLSTILRLAAPKITFRPQRTANEWRFLANLTPYVWRNRKKCVPLRHIKKNVRDREAYRT